MTNSFLGSERRNIFLYYVLTVAISCYFISTNWLYFWTRLMTYGQLGWVDASGFGFGLLLEVPSGAVADLFGKRKTILFGMAAGAIGVWIITFSATLTGLIIGWLIAQFAYAFFSGAGEALAYDSLIDLKEEHNFDKVIAKSSELGAWTAAIATLSGGLLYLVDIRLPHFLWGAAFAVGAVAAYFLIEPKVDTEKFSFKKYFSQLFMGVKELTQTGLRRYLGFFFALVGIYFMYSWGLVRPAIATSFGFFSKEQAFILPALMILSAIVVKTIPYLRRKFSDLQGLVILSVLMAVGFISASFPIGWYGLITMIVIAVTGHLASPWISILVNKRIDSKNRATTLSTVALLTKMPYVLLAVTAGKMVEAGNLGGFNLAVGAGIIAVTLISLLLIYTKRSKFPNPTI